MKRRHFAKNTSLAVGSLFLLRCKAENTMKQAADAVGTETVNEALSDFGLQLWSVRDAMKENPYDTLKALSEIGYTDIESAGYNEGSFYGMRPKEFKMVLGNLKLKMRSTHTNTGTHIPDTKGTMTNNWDMALTDAKEVGAKSIVCGWIHENERKTLDDYKRMAELFNKCGERANAYNMKFGFHNHDFEFWKIDDQVPYDILLKETDADKVFFEMDHYWVKKGGADSFEYFKNHKGRFPVWHVKDMDDTKEQFFTEVGSGTIDYVELFKEAKMSGLEYFYVEQDAFKNIEPIASVEKSHDYLRTLKV